MQETSTRIRWNDDERAAVVAAMAPLLARGAGLSKLDALRQAQLVLPESRRRELKTWAAVQPVLEERLTAALALLSGSSQGGPACPPATATESPGEEQLTEAAILQESAAEAAQPAAASAVTEPLAGSPLIEADADLTAPLPVAPSVQQQAARPPSSASAEEPSSTRPLSVRTVAEPAPADASAAGVERERLTLASVKWADALEAAMLTALQSPAVEEALVDVFSRALARAGTAVQARTPKEASPLADSRPARILLAGFPPPATKSLEDSLRPAFDVRSWKPVQGPQLLETLAKLCSIAVIPEEADDEMGQALRDRHLQVVRHAGNTQRLAERLEELLA